jgi:hypothetical protein
VLRLSYEAAQIFFARSTNMLDARVAVQPIGYTQATQQPNCDIFATLLVQFKR